VNIETKDQSKQWVHTHSPNKPKQFKQTLSTRKLMATVFWDRKGVLMVEFMQHGTTITSEVCCKTLNNEKLTKGAKIWLRSQVADFFDRDIQKLTPQYKYPSSSCDYTEK
jgi:hypothetical protein